MLLNINTNRRYWHAGPGCDDENIFNRYKKELDELGEPAKLIDKKTEKLIKKLWQNQLEKQ